MKKIIFVKCTLSMRLGIDVASNVSPFFFFFQRFLHCSWDINSAFRLMNNNLRMNSNFFIYCFQQNKQYPNGPLGSAWIRLKTHAFGVSTFFFFFLEKKIMCFSFRGQLALFIIVHALFTGPTTTLLKKMVPQHYSHI